MFLKKAEQKMQLLLFLNFNNIIVIGNLIMFLK